MRARWAVLFGVVSAVLLSEIKLIYANPSFIWGSDREPVCQQFGGRRLLVGPWYTLLEKYPKNSSIDDLTEKETVSGLAMSVSRISIVHATENGEQLSGFLKKSLAKNAHWLGTRNFVFGENSKSADAIIIRRPHGIATYSFLLRSNLLSSSIPWMHCNARYNSNINGWCVAIIFKRKIHPNIYPLTAVPVAKYQRINQGYSRANPRPLVVLHNIQLAAYGIERERGEDRSEYAGDRQNRRPIPNGALGLIAVAATIFGFAFVRRALELSGGWSAYFWLCGIGSAICGAILVSSIIGPHAG